MRTLHLAILRSAALLVSSEQRAEWLAEWESELWYVNKRMATAFCLGAFQDAIWLGRNSPRPNVWRKIWLESPLWCIFFLAVVAAVSMYFAFRLPGPRDMILPPYRHARDLVMVSNDKGFPGQHPTISFAEYQSLTRATHLFTALAFYQPIPTRVRTTGRQTAELSLAHASRNLFDLLDIPVSSREPGETAILILSRTAWREYFDGDPKIAGQVLEVAGRQAVVAGVVSDDSWRLPGRMDAWLLLDEQRLAGLPPEAKGFVLARVLAPQRGWRWRVSVENESGVYRRFDCTSLAQRQPILPYVLLFIIALLISRATTSLALGEYPANRHSPPLTTRLRRWIFLAVKIALLSVIVFFGILDLAWITSTPIQPHGWLVGYVFALRWALKDQRKRCPVCLRLLTNPIQIGRISQIFLEWYGTELMCARGHGLLHVTEIPTSCYSTQRWLYLDDSWSNLFSSRKAGAIL